MPSFSGCFGEEEVEEITLKNPFDDFQNEIPITTFYHFPNGTWINGTDDMYINGSLILEGNNSPFYSEATYYSIGYTTFEPTIGVTSNGAIIFTNYRGAGDGTHMIRSIDNGQNWEDVGPFNPVFPDTGQVPSSNDPYVYVDPWTDRIMKFDMHALGGMTVEWSDDEGASWSLPYIATGYSVQDHQTIASSPYGGILHETLWVFCINGNWPSPLCSASQDGGFTWGPELPGAPIDCQSGGLSAHIIGADNGNFYRGQIGCNGEGYSMYKTDNGALTWSEHVLPTEESGTADTWNAEEAQVDTDSESNVYAMWMGYDNLPYFSYSVDDANTWSDAVMIAPGHLQGTGFPVVIAGDPGRVAFGYIGEDGDGFWDGYISVMTDAFNETPLITTVQVNADSDPLDNASPTCGYERCGGFGDFIDMQIDAYGRPWLALSHNPNGDTGIFGTLTNGPTLFGNLTALTEIPEGGPQTL